MLMTMTTSTLKCLRCEHQWEPRKTGRPLQCPNCKQTRWDQPSKWMAAAQNAVARWKNEHKKKGRNA